MKQKRYLCCLVAITPMLLGGVACGPATISRIGPRMPQRPADCQIEILPEDQVPSRPYRNIGMVALKNCQDFRTQPCSNWLRKAACELGGQVAYLPPRDRPDSPMDAVNYRVFVAVYASDVRGDPADDPVVKARTCDPPCTEDERCVDGICKNAADCEAAAAALQKQEEATPSPERCTE
ncbi:MAG: hypothetical protein QNJ97_01950 [Myxococcota bacterium]|nr:hypothetical protein [Myxococcota bacterium]